MKRNISIIAAVIAITITLFFFYIWRSFQTVSAGPSPLGWVYDIPQDDTSFGGLFASPENFISDSLPKYEYKRLEDSLTKIFSTRRFDNKSQTGAGISYGPIGVAEIEKAHADVWEESKKDSIMKLLTDSMNGMNKKWTEIKDNADSLTALKKKLGDLNWKINVRANELLKKKQKIADYYFVLNGYSLDYDTKFFVQNGTYNLAYVKWDTTIKRTFDSTKHGHYERKQIPVRYATDEKKILVPISRKQYNLINAGIQIWLFVWLFLFVYFFIGLPIQILIDISKGNAFNKKNISRFKIMAYVLFAYALVSTLSPYVFKFFFRKWIPDDFTSQSFLTVLLSNSYLYLIAIAIFIVGLAFQKGYKLQQEQDLTI